jgi:hypothetical protein
MPLPLERRALVIVLIAALAVRMAAAIWWEQRLPEGHRFGLADSESYWTLGKAIAEHRPYEYGGRDARVFRTPGYPLLLAAIIGIAGDTVVAQWIARIVGALLGTLCTALLMLWTSFLFPTRKAVLCAGLMAAFYPGLIALSVILLSEALFCPLIVAQLLCWTRAEQVTSRNRWAWSAAAGFFAGAATLARPSWFLFVPFAGAMGILLGRNRARRLAVVLIMLAVLVITMVPWWIRNYRVVGRFVPTTLQVGASLYDGLNPQASGASNMWFANDYYHRLEQERRAGKLESQPLEVALDHRLRHDALQWATSHPWRALQLALIKFSRMWNVWPNDEQFRSVPVRLVIAAAYVFIGVVVVGDAEAQATAEHTARAAAEAAAAQAAEARRVADAALRAVAIGKNEADRRAAEEAGAHSTAVMRATSEATRRYEAESRAREAAEARLRAEETLRLAAEEAAEAERQAIAEADAKEKALAELIRTRRARVEFDSSAREAAEDRICAEQALLKASAAVVDAEARAVAELKARLAAVEQSLQQALQEAAAAVSEAEARADAEAKAKLAAVEQALAARRERIAFEARVRKAAEVRARAEAIAAQAARAHAEAEEQATRQALARARATLG